MTEILPYGMVEIKPEKPEDELLADIRKVLVWYSNHGAGAGIDDLLEHRDTLAILSYGLAERAGNRFIEYNNSYFIRVVRVSKIVNAMVKQGMAVNRAESEAKELQQETIKNEKDAEGAAFLADKLLKQVNKILEAMNQRISNLKQEHYQTLKQDSP